MASEQLASDLIGQMAEPAVTHRGMPYRADIDGLRAVAVLAVVLYHAGVTTVGGGFVGVDVFFVISGYLIMSVIATDVRERRFSLADFYERRIRRIFPALFVVVAFCLVGATLLLPPNHMLDFGKSLAAMALFASNFYFRGLPTARGYFDTSVDDQVLLHTWSLAVEEQFYILLPIVLVLMRRFRPRATPIVLGALACASLGWAVYIVHVEPKSAFFFVFSRAWELLVGSLLAIGVAPPPPKARWLREGVALLGLALIAVAVFGYDKTTLFPGLSALPPVMGAALVIYAGAGGASQVACALSLPPVRFVGLISYSLYLWHWPLIVLQHLLGLGAAFTPLVVAASFVAAVLSYRFVEVPFRRRDRFARRPLLIAGGGAMALAAFAGLAIMATGGLVQRFPASNRAAFLANLERKQENPEHACLNFRRDVASPADITTCPVGRPDGMRKVVFWGDSHVAQFRPLAEALAAEGVFGDREVLFATSGGCLPDPTLNRTDGYHCPHFARAAESLVLGPKVDAVLFGFSSWFDFRPDQICQVQPGGEGCVRPIERRQIAEHLADEIRRVGGALKRRGVPFVVMLPMPIYSKGLPDYEIERMAHPTLAFDLGPGDAPLRFDFEPIRDTIAAAAREAGATIFDPRATLCQGAECRWERDRVSLYTDATHVAASQMGLFHDAMAKAFGQLVAGR